MTDIYISIDYKIHSSVMDEPEDCITIINGKVVHYNESDEKETIAKCRHFFIDLENSGNDPYFLLDIRSELAPYTALYDSETASFKDELLVKAGDDIWSTNLLVVDRIEILPEFRGEGISKMIFQDAIRLFSPRTDLVAIKCFPIQFEAKIPDHKPSAWEKMMELDKLDPNEKTATKRLMSFYESLGFIPFGNDGIMVKSITKKLETPNHSMLMPA